MVIPKSLIWTKSAYSDLQKIFDFNAKIFGIAFARKVVAEIIEKASILEKPSFNYTEIGEVDKDFDYLKRDCRKLIEGHCKITYRIGKSKIYINRIFTRDKIQIKTNRISSF
jgi:plasmid stabilization system protein ParE